MARMHTVAGWSLTALIGFAIGRSTAMPHEISRAKVPASSPPSRVEPPRESVPCPSAAPQALSVPVVPEQANETRAVASPVKPVSRASVLGAFRFAGFGPNGGLRLGRVTAGTLPDLLGLKTGDEIISLNGFRIAEPQQALLAYAKLPYTDDWVARIARSGRITEIRYALR